MLSGVSAARLCVRLGAVVIGFDQRPRAELGEAARALPIELRQGLTRENLAGSDLVVVSPGVDQPALLPQVTRLAPRLSEVPHESLGQILDGWLWKSMPFGLTLRRRILALPYGLQDVARAAACRLHRIFGV